MKWKNIGIRSIDDRKPLAQLYSSITCSDIKAQVNMFYSMFDPNVISLIHEKWINIKSSKLQAQYINERRTTVSSDPPI